MLLCYQCVQMVTDQKKPKHLNHDRNLTPKPKHVDGRLRRVSLFYVQSKAGMSPLNLVQTYTHTHIHTHTRLTALCPGLPG